MKIITLISALLLSTIPAWGQYASDGGVLEGENYAMTYRRVPGTKHLYAVSVIEPRSLKDGNGFTVPTALAVDCKKGEVKGFVAMGNKDAKFINGVLIYYMSEFCSKNGYNNLLL